MSLFLTIVVHNSTFCDMMPPTGEAPACSDYLQIVPLITQNIYMKQICILTQFNTITTKSVQN